MDRREFLLQISFALGAALAGCGSSSEQTSGAPATTPTTTPAEPVKSLFPGYPDPPDLTALGEMPPTEILQPERFFGRDEPDLHPPLRAPQSFLDTFEYVVVVMLENRAFDHFAGYLYPGSTSINGDKYNGAGGQNFSNPAPGGGTIPFVQATSLQTPLIDPAETYASLNTALFGSFNPASNSEKNKETEFAAPYNLPDSGAYFPPPMSGFATMFEWALRTAKKPTDLAAVRTIMEGLTPNLIPVWSQLAQGFTICDNWFCGVPSQTYCNRSMFNAASSAGFVNNSPVLKWPIHNTTKTIWDRLHEAKVPWTIYFDADDIICGTSFINNPSLRHLPNFPQHMYHFYDAVKDGKLPRYSWVQPRLIISQNSYHPDAGAPGIKKGEVLLNDIYTAIRNSNNANGSNYLNTLLILTFDEGGTCYDHVPPPAAVPPGDGYQGELGFDFKRHGQRIPTVLISPWLKQGSVVSELFDATTVIRTLEVKFGLQNLTARDAASVTLANVPFLSTPRTRSQMPNLRVRKLTEEEQFVDLNAPLVGGTGPGIVKMAHAMVTGVPDDLPAGVQTVGEALAWLKANLHRLPPEVKGS